jgi:hypothetical protein
MYLFTTWERDNKTITKNEGKYFCKMYGLPVYEITEEEVKRIAWFELNRRGKFEHLIIREGVDIPKMTNEPAQKFLVERAINYGI